MATGRKEEEQFCVSLGSDDLCEIVCMPCHEDGAIQIAVGMCLDCQDYLCQRCFDVHKTPKPMRNHELITNEQMLKSKVSLARKDKCTEICDRHDGEVIKYYCKNHRQLGCSVCLSLDHRTCDGVTYIPDVAKDLTKNQEYKQAESKLNMILEKFNYLSEKTNQTADMFFHNCSAAVTGVREFRKQINDALDRIEVGLIKKAENMKSEMKSKVTDVTEKVSSVQTEVQQLMSQANSLLNKGQNCELFTFHMKLKDKLQSMDTLLKEMEIKHSVRTAEIKFAPNTDILMRLEDPEIFGKLVETATATMQREPETRTIVKAEHMNDINVRHDSDSKLCYITGSVVMFDNNLLLADYNNKCIKAVDTKSSKVIKYLKLSCAPWDVAMISNNQAAVTLLDERKIAVIETGAADMTMERTIYVNDRCFGVDYKEDRLAVSFPWSNKVIVFNLQGAMLCTIENNKGKDLFNMPYYIAFGQIISTLYVSNLHNNSVVCVNVDGSLITTYKDNILEYPRGLLVDRSGNIYVCGQTSHNIHQISPDCKKIQILLTKTDGLDQLHSICYSETDHKIFLGMQGTNMVKVFKSILGTV